MRDSDGVHDKQRLQELQALPLDRKIQITQTRIIEWYTRNKGNVTVSFSGGKDSLVVLHLTRQLYPDTPAVFANTGLEYPEIRKFALSFPNVEEIRPTWGRAGKRRGRKPEEIMTFKDVLTYYGYPIFSKQISAIIEGTRINPNASRAARMFGEYNADWGAEHGKTSMFDYRKWRPVIPLPVRISDVCCKRSKESPLRRYQTRTGRAPITGTMAEESIQRRTAWYRTGCNAFDIEYRVSKPLSFWTGQDVLEYIKHENLPICSVYGDIVENPKTGKLQCTGCARTGCIFCAFGAHLERGETRFQRLARTHPKLYEYCMSGGSFQPNPDFDPSKPESDGSNRDVWNLKTLWQPDKGGLGMAKVFDMVNEIYGKNFIRY